ncbi:hypothetical protein [Thiomicrorhabdus heinhorstiae]|uniref:Uncharacterized protein n=1 Tax=Thiomicrorhabdus heinhorstiae TaxID=2748010 RepID=A0ABS0BUI1_9GAMM|nr:hypothetical protein [Thiomicrorhabdus heinhorstiae]MBF6057495.1 hypothetical protein [Thiomicrorhabdus heinhorstiae]
MNLINKTAISASITLALGLTASALSGCYDSSSNYSDTNTDTVDIDPNAPFQDEENISSYAKKAVNSLKAQGFLPVEARFNPQDQADLTFAETLLNISDLGSGYLTYGDAKKLINDYLIIGHSNENVSIEGFLSKKNKSYQDSISREDFAYMVSQARQANFLETGLPIHNPAIATPGPLLGPTVFQSGGTSENPEYDGSTVSIFHRAKNGVNTTFADSPVFTLQVHPEVFKSVSIGGIDVDSLQDLSAQLEVELTDGSIHRTPLTSMIPFSIHGADGKKGVIRIEDGILVLVEDLQGNIDAFDLNGRTFSVQDVIHQIQTQSYYNGETTNTDVAKVITDELSEHGFSLQDRRIMLHNLILAKTALQQSSLTPLSAPFNTIAGPSSRSRGFSGSSLFSTYRLVDSLLSKVQNGQMDEVRSDLNSDDNQQNLLTGTKILTAATLLPHISSLANAPFLPNEELSSRVKKSGALLPSEPIVFQFDRLKRAAFILLDDALSQGNAAHLVTKGEIVKDSSAENPAFSLSADNFEAVPIQIKESVVVDALWDFKKSYEMLIQLISGVDVTESLTVLNEQEIALLETAFSNPVMNNQMADIKIGDLNFKMDMLATPSHIGDAFAPANDLTQFRDSEAFGLADALQPFPERLIQYICEGKVVSAEGNILGDAKIAPDQQLDLITDVSSDAPLQCTQALSSSPRYKQLLFVDNFQLPPFGPEAKFISTQGIEIINRILFTPENPELDIADIRLTYRLSNQ